MNGTESIRDKQGRTLAIIIRNDFNQDGVHFFTPGEFSQQMAFISHPAGKKIGAHRHKKVKREVRETQEALFLRKGRLKVNLYDDEKIYIATVTLGAGDVVLLVSGGHGFEVLEPVEMVEVKQGPYLDDSYKENFKGIE